MPSFSLQHGDFLVRYDVTTGGLSILDGRRNTPWFIDLAQTARVEVRSHGTIQSHRIPLDDLTTRQLGPSHLQWLGTVGGAECAFEIRVGEEGVGFAITDLGSGEAEVVSAIWPGAILLRGDGREICWSNCNRQGALFRADGQPWQKDENLGQVAMRFCGLSSAGASLVMIAETSADARWRFEDDGRDTMSAKVEFGPSMGSLAYTRKLLLVPLERPGHVEIARAFRAYAQRHGLWMSWEERVSQNPLVDKLRGAFVACAGYWYDEGADQARVMRQMREYGFTRGYLFSPRMIMQGRAWTNWLGVEMNRMTEEELTEIQARGFLAAPFLQVEEIDESFEGGRRFARGPMGEKVKRWQIGDCDFYEIAKWHVPATLPRYDVELQSAQAVHFDTLTSAPLIEHHGERSYDRRGDAALRMEVARYYRGRGKVVGAEGFRDWAVRTVDLGTAKTFCPVDVTDRRVWVIPLTELVYHDSGVYVTWEHNPYDDDRCVHSLLEKYYFPFGIHLTNLLTCSPPVLFPEGKLYEYQHREVVREDGETEWEILWDQATPYSKRFTEESTQAALPKALEACQLHQRHGSAQMLSHSFPDEGCRFVQQSEFASGLRVTVNYGEEDYTLPDGRTVGARSSLVEE